MPPIQGLFGMLQWMAFRDMRIYSHQSRALHNPPLSDVTIAKGSSKYFHPLLLFFILSFFLIGGYLLYSIALVSATHQHASATGVHMPSPSWTSSHLPPRPTSLGCHRALGWAPCVTEQIPNGILLSYKTEHKVSWKEKDKYCILTHTHMESRKMVLMNLFAGQQWKHRRRKQTWEAGWAKLRE